MATEWYGHSVCIADYGLTISHLLPSAEEQRTVIINMTKPLPNTSMNMRLLSVNVQKNTNVLMNFVVKAERRYSIMVYIEICEVVFIDFFQHAINERNTRNEREHIS